MNEQLSLLDIPIAPQVEATETAHHCHAVGCDETVPPKMLMCPKHWRMVPKKLQQAVWRTYRLGQEITKNPSPEYLAAAKAAIAAVQKAEDKLPKPSLSVPEPVPLKTSAGRQNPLDKNGALIQIGDFVKYAAGGPGLANLRVVELLKDGRLRLDRIQGSKITTQYADSSLMVVVQGNPSVCQFNQPLAASFPSRFAAGDIVTIAPLRPEQKDKSCAPSIRAGVVVSHSSSGYVRVDVGAPGNALECTEERLAKYGGVVSLWRLGQATYCDRSNCKPHCTARPFTCSVCGSCSIPQWWYVGQMSAEPSKPKWPDAVWFPANYDPNLQGKTDDR